MPAQCPSTTGPGPCMNPAPHDAPHGCVHHSTSGQAHTPKEEL